MKKLLNYFMLFALLGVIGCSSSKDDPIYDAASISKILVDGVTRANVSKEAHVYEFEVPADMDLKALAIDVTITDGYATNFKNDPKKKRDLTDGLKINIQGDNGDLVEWTIKVKHGDRVGEAGAIKNLKINGTEYANQNLEEGVLEYTVAFTEPTDLKKLKLDITLSEGAEFDGYENDANKEQDLTNPLEVKVKGTDGEIYKWTIIITEPTIKLDGKDFRFSEIESELLDNQEGLVYTKYTITDKLVNDKGLIFYSVEFDRTKAKDYAIGAVLPDGVEDYKLGARGDVKTIFNANPKALAAIPGDFHNPSETVRNGMLPYGLITVNGVTVKRASEPAWELTFGIDKDGVPFIDDVTLEASIKGKDGAIYPTNLVKVNDPLRAEDQLLMITSHYQGKEGQDPNKTGQNEWGSEGYYIPTGTKNWYKQVDPANTPIENVGRLQAVAGGIELSKTNLILSGNGKAATFLNNMNNVGSGSISIKAKSKNSDKTYSVMTSIGSQGYVLKDGVITPGSNIATSNHARAAIGHSKDGNKVFMLVVDGEAASTVSAGATPTNLGEIFQFLGASDAVNIQGGSSSALVVKGETVNVQVSNKKIPNMIGVVKK